MFALEPANHPAMRCFTVSPPVLLFEEGRGAGRRSAGNSIDAPDLAFHFWLRNRGEKQLIVFWKGCALAPERAIAFWAEACTRDRLRVEMDGHATSEMQTACDTESAYPAPGWRNWQTQRTQNPPTLAVMGVRPPLPAPAKQLWNLLHMDRHCSSCLDLCPNCAQSVPKLPPTGIKMRHISSAKMMDQAALRPTRFYLAYVLIEVRPATHLA